MQKKKAVQTLVSAETMVYSVTRKITTWLNMLREMWTLFHVWTPAHMEKAQPSQDLLWFQWPAAPFRAKRSFNATCHRGFHILLSSALRIEESSVFVARLKSPRFLFLASEQRDQHVTFTNLLPPSSHWILLWKIPPQAKVEVAVRKQVWGHWNPSFKNK